jgi:hypothetical protein
MRVLSISLVVVVVTGAGCTEPKADDIENVRLTPKQHAEDFPIDEAATHALDKDAYGGPMSCDSCHQGTATFAEFKCVECHEHDGNEWPGTPLLTVHGGIAGFNLGNQYCLSCHPDGTSGSEQGLQDHDTNDFPINTATPHGDAAYLARVPVGETTCTACHASVEDRSVLLCAECHADDAVPLADVHNDSPGFTTSFNNGDDSPGCKKCHGTTPVPPAVVPATAHNDIFIVFPSHHNAQRCEQCHSTYEPEPKPWTIDWKASSCIPCHLAACAYDAASPNGGNADCP